MNQLVERFATLPRSQRLLVALLAYVLIVLVAWFALLSPVIDETDAAVNERTTLQGERSSIKERAESLPEVQAELERMKGDLVQALTELPNDREIPGLLSEIDGLAKRSGLDVKRFQPLPESFDEYYAEVPVQIVMAGSYHEVAIFFDRVRRMNRIVSIEDIEITDPVLTGTETKLTVSGKVTTFRFLTEDELKESRANADGKKRRDGDGGGE
ncbi:MAG: type pilus biosis protein PilO [Pseudomonadota bacterium]|jgi:type IV pilus assembly protein PilO